MALERSMELEYIERVGGEVYNHDIDTTNEKYTYCTAIKTT